MTSLVVLKDGDVGSEEYFLGTGADDLRISWSVAKRFLSALVGDGMAFVLGGLNITPRDDARFAQVFMNGGRWNGSQILPEGWVKASTRATAPTAPEHIGYGYQWWVPRGAVTGEYMARGIYGQYIYVNRPLGVVIATTAADKTLRKAGVSEQSIAMFRKIAEGI